MKRALICGVSGQDGAYLAQLLLSKGYAVFGSSRDIANTDFHNLARLGILSRVKLLNMKTSDIKSIQDAFELVMPDEVYNLSGQSSVGLSFEFPEETRRSIVNATENILEELRTHFSKSRFFSAGSGECFGVTQGTPANEDTPFNPLSPYAQAKVDAYKLVKKYRDDNGLYVCTGLLFNHESPLRSTRFVTQKIIRAAIEISRGRLENLTLGNLAIKRDWGWAPDYVEAMWLMLQQERPSDYVIATGIGHTLEDFVNTVFLELGLNWKNHVMIDQSLFRPNEGLAILADPSKAKELLGWQAKLSLREVISKMMDEAQKNLVTT
jgi:GDPmannose 4,6-dehydratase